MLISEYNLSNMRYAEHKAKKKEGKTTREYRKGKKERRTDYLLEKIE